MKTCWHCAKRRVTLSWNLRLCADGRRKRVPQLCRSCDAALNAYLMRFLRLKAMAR